MEPQNLPESILNHPSMKGISGEDLKKGLTRIMPLLQMAAQMTENPYDDLAVEFLKNILTAMG